MSAGLRRQAPPFPRRVDPLIHPECGDRLIEKRGPLGNLISRVHESTGSLRCPPIQRTCSVCEKDALVACLNPKCTVVGHPGCLHQCACCLRWGCPVHVQLPELTCDSCASHGPVPDHEIRHE